MSTALGLIGLVVFIVCIISLAAGVTYVVVRLSPSPDKKKAKAAAAAAAGSGDG